MKLVHAAKTEHKIETYGKQTCRQYQSCKVDLKSGQKPGRKEKERENRKPRR
jgi:hypothetical protein